MRRQGTFRRERAKRVEKGSRVGAADSGSDAIPVHVGYSTDSLLYVSFVRGVAQEGGRNVCGFPVFRSDDSVVNDGIFVLRSSPFLSSSLLLPFLNISRNLDSHDCVVKQRNGSCCWPIKEEEEEMPIQEVSNFAHSRSRQ